MTNARALLASAVLIALALAGAAWWIVRGIPADRYQLVNVGKGETQRIDHETGTIMRCAYGRCEALTEGAKAIDKPVVWHGEDIPPPPPGYTLDK